VTPASFDPTIDYVVVKIPRWNFEKFPQADRTLTTQMKSVGEAMAIGRTFKEAFLKGIRSLELGRDGLLFDRPPSAGADAPPDHDDEEDASLRRQLIVPSDRRIWALFRALDKAWTVDQICELTKMDRWFVEQFAEIVELRRTAEMIGLRDMSPDLLRTL
jgi:carbamoyl-phosphate synthase large subunit